MTWRLKLADWLTGGAVSEILNDYWELARERNVYSNTLYGISLSPCCDGCKAAKDARAAVEEWK